MLPDITKKTEDKIRKTITEKRLMAPKQHIVTGLSGGPDSVCLFNVLMKLKDEFQWTVHPVHVNHKFRPGAAERDQRYVEDLCRRSGVECRTFVVDCNGLAEEFSMTSEEAGRKARYDAFVQVAERIAEDVPKEDIKIAVAQNANDQAETVMFRFLRGTGVDGLAGIAYERDERGFKVIRPLLDVYRNEIEEYCDCNNLQPVIDHTNEETVFARNKIRHRMIPYIEEEYNSNIKESLVRLARIAAADKDYMWQQAEAAYEKYAAEKADAAEVTMEREALAKLHVAVRHRVILKAFAAVGLDSDISEERIKAADFIIERKQSPKTVQFPRGHVLIVAKGIVTVKKL